MNDAAGSDASLNEAPAPEEPSAASLAELPELDDSKLRRIPGRGHHVHLCTGSLDDEATR